MRVGITGHFHLIYGGAVVIMYFAIAHELVTFMSADHKEALAAIREKRQPHFRGR